jgi:hypothetical protein
VHYKITPGIVVKTENAAKPEKQSSSYLRFIISNLEPVSSSFDYGCGKLRYKGPILQKTDTLVLVDSEVQLSRKQILGGKLTTIRALIQRSNRVAACNTMEFAEHQSKFDRGFCINVLSVIPFFSIRKRVLSLIRQRLRPGGTCLFVVQYRNSDFSRMRAMPNALPWRDGFLIDSLRGFSFYGLISPEQLVAAVSGAGFEIIEQRLNEGSVYLLARTASTHESVGIIDIDEGRNFHFQSK